MGACVRYLFLLMLPAQGFPYSTFAINILGCYVIYLIYQWFGRRVHLPGAIVNSMGIGLVGAFTTLSAFDIECVRMLQAGEYTLCIVYITLTFVCTFAASLAGWGTNNLLLRHRMRMLKQKRRELSRKRHEREEAEHETPGGDAQ